MSLVNKILAYYEDHPRRKKAPTGWPTGSRLGQCTAQMQMQRFPQRYPADPLSGRSLRVFEEGDRTEAWLGEVLNRVYPNTVGMKQELLYFAVALSSDQKVEIMERIANGLIWGRVMEQFTPPKLELGEDGRVKGRLIPRDDKGESVRWGFILDLEHQCVWVPTYIDFAVKDEELGLVICDTKSMSNFAFRRALLGDIGYRYQAQFSGFARASGAHTALIAYRKETSHLCEIDYLRGIQRTRVLLTKTSGGQEVFFVENNKLVPEGGGAPIDIPANSEWEGAQVWTPYDEAIDREVDARVLAVLLFDGDPQHLLREYGPDFKCWVCQGTGIQTLQKGKIVPLKTPKPCEDCGGTGLLAEAELDFPCSYCSVLKSCLASAPPRFEVDDKPHFYVNRAAYEQSGLTFTTPEGWS